MILRKESYHQEHEKLLNYITYRKALVVSLMSIHSSLGKVTQGGEGDTPNFKWRGWSKDLVLNFQFRDFFGGEKNLASIFLGGLIYKVGFLGGFKTNWRLVVVPAYPSRKHNSHSISNQVIFVLYHLMLSGMFWGLVFGSGICLGFDFCPHLIISVTWNRHLPPPHPLCGSHLRLRPLMLNKRCDKIERELGMIFWISLNANFNRRLLVFVRFSARASVL